MRWTSKEYARYKDIRVHYDFHFAARTREKAAATSDRFIPACLAWRRALAIMRSKSRMEGVWMALRRWVSSLLTTRYTVLYGAPILRNSVESEFEHWEA